jgi:hypothetical protein
MPSLVGSSHGFLTRVRAAHNEISFCQDGSLLAVGVDLRRGRVNVS